MICLACGGSARGGLCGRCRDGLRPGGERLIDGRLAVRAAFLHVGPARGLVRRLKYQGLVAAAGPLAAAMAPLLDPAPPAVVPVPRAWMRRWRHGVDPGYELAGALAAEAGVPVAAALRPGLWHRPRAGPGGRSRGTPVFRPRAPMPAGSLLVDDVVTTGATLLAAFRVLGTVGGAVTATAAPSLSGPSERRGRCRPAT